MLTEEAEYGKWELARLRLYVGGHRKVAAASDHPRELHALTRPTAPTGGPQQVCRNRRSTRTPNSTDSTGTRSSTPWNMPAKSSSGGSRSGANP